MEGRILTAFDSTWSLIKEWTPDWRRKARRLPELDWHEVLQYGRKPEHIEDRADYLGGGGSFVTFEHPYDNKFVIKIPRYKIADNSNIDWQGDETNMKFMNRRTGFPTGEDIQVGHPLPSILERFGYPIASEINVDDNYLIQPYIEDSTYPQAERRNRRNERPSYNTVDKLLHHTFGDRYPSNFGIDQTGNYRFIDPDMDYKSPLDWLPTSFPSNMINLRGSTRGEALQQRLDKYGIQLPASPLLNTLDKYGFERKHHSGLFDLLTEIEPYSDNPQSVLIDGRAEFLEGY